MNLIIDPWIPVLRADGRRELAGLAELFAQGHELRDLAVKPHERIALMRLLICITQAALDGPADEESWRDCRPQIQPRVREYLGKWKAAFELFGDKQRFLQFCHLKPGKDTDGGNAATKLDLALASGNNATLFDNSAEEGRTMQVARAACGLLTFQCFSPGGRIGVVKWNGGETPGKGASNHAPCTPSSMVHTLVLGETLLASIHQNLLSKDMVTDFYGPKHWGKPVWEHPVETLEDRQGVENATQTYLGRLAPMSRAVRLQGAGETMILGNGLEYPAFPGFREATATVVRRKDELALLPASTSRSLWRQLPAIAVKRRADAESASGPIALNHQANGGSTTLWVGAFITDKAKIEDVVESTYSLPAGLFTELGRAAYEQGVVYAEGREGALIQAVKAYAAALKSGSPAYDRARQVFWTRAEQSLSTLFSLASNPDQVADMPESAWGKAMEAAGREAYERCAPRQTPRQIEAYALGLRKLAFRPKPAPQPVS